MSVFIEDSFIKVTKMERISELEREIAELRKNLMEKENTLYELKQKFTTVEYPPCAVINSCARAEIGDKLPRWAIERYSRQILLSEIGVSGQVKLSDARVLIVGAGGLGSPAAMYLAGAGVGEIGIVDYDTVDVTNIHRQLLYREDNQYLSKVDAAANALKKMNSHITVTPYNLQLDSATALQIVSRYHAVLDCSDNVPTRYMLNDACVLLKIPLISGSALKMEGQLTIYNHKEGSHSGPCYRCLFESPPPPETVGSCAASGVCGPICGTIGTLQALEAIKLIVGVTYTKMLVGRMLIFDGEDMTFRIVKLRPKNPNCAACSENPKITQLLDYEQFCKTRAKEKDLELDILPPENRTSAAQLAKLLEETTRAQKRHLLVDVRNEAQFYMCHIDGAVNWPIDSLDECQIGELCKAASSCDVTFVCRRGNDSQIVAQRIIDAAPHLASRVKDLRGGLHAWSNEVDPEFPIY